MPFDLLFDAADEDGALGGIVHEVVRVAGCVLYDGDTPGDGLLSQWCPQNPRLENVPLILLGR